MSDEIGSVQSIDESEQPLSAAELSRLNQANLEADAVQTNLREMAASAIATAAERPLAPTQSERLRADLVGESGSTVSEMKADLISDTTRPGTESAAEGENVSFEAELEDRVRSLYADLTNYQVAWRIAQKIPQDLTQILRGN